MSEAKHTPGPWLTHPWSWGNDPRWRVIRLGSSGGSPGLAVIHPRPGMKPGEAAANARLIAAAPELLEALIDVIALYQWKKPGFGEATDHVKAARRAIAKATDAA